MASGGAGGQLSHPSTSTGDNSHASSRKNERISINSNGSCPPSLSHEFSRNINMHGAITYQYTRTVPYPGTVPGTVQCTVRYHLCTVPGVMLVRTRSTIINAQTNNGVSQIPGTCIYMRLQLQEG